MQGNVKRKMGSTREKNKFQSMKCFSHALPCMQHVYCMCSHNTPFFFSFKRERQRTRRITNLNCFLHTIHDNSLTYCICKTMQIIGTFIHSFMQNQKEKGKRNNLYYLKLAFFSSAEKQQTDFANHFNHRKERQASHEEEIVIRTLRCQHLFKSPSLGPELPPDDPR